MPDAHGELRGMIADVPDAKKANLMATLLIHQAHKLPHAERCKAIGMLLCAVRATAMLQFLQFNRADGVEPEEIAEMIPHIEARLTGDLASLNAIIEKLS